MNKILWMALLIGTLMTGMMFKADAEVMPIMGLEVGCIFNDEALNNSCACLGYESENNLFVQMKAGVRWNRLEIIGTYRNILVLKDIGIGSETQDTFDIDIVYTIRDFKIGFKNRNSKVFGESNTLSNTGQNVFHVSYYKEF